MAISMAALANAATANWSASALALAPSAVSVSTYSAFLIDNTLAGYADYAAASAAILADGSGASGVIAAVDGRMQDKTTSMNLIASGTSIVDNGYASGSGNAINIMMIVFDAASDDLDAAGYYLGASKANASFNNSMALNAGFGNQSSASWVQLSTPTPGPEDVPEPTSGLLMLIGAAGLALRRKRA